MSSIPIMTHHFVRQRIDAVRSRTVPATMFVAVVITTMPARAADKPFAHVQATPLPHLHQVVFEHDGRELVRYHYDASYERPFWFPLIGPANRRVTRMAHPHDPEGHSHHNSVWVAHQKVNGVNFWEDPGPAKIVHQRIERFDDAPDQAALQTRNTWLGPDGKAILNERRRMTVRPLNKGEWMLIVELHITPAAGDVTFGKTSFGLFATRVAKTMSVADGGGTITNSEGGVNEKAVFWKPARWMDTSGRVTADRVNGVTVMDHPSNPNHPTLWHVRNDGWMGASFSLKGPVMLAKGKALRLLYAVLVHDGPCESSAIERHFRRFAKKSYEIK